MIREKVIESLIRMRVLASPEDGIFNVTPYDETGMPNTVSKFIRCFNPIKVEKNRKPCAQPNINFDIYSDTLSDSPVSIAAKLGGGWEMYNNHAIVQVGICNFRCWYCYVDYKFLSGQVTLPVNADDLVSSFLDIRKKFVNQLYPLNVLRISGGEPLLVPDLTLSCLKIIQKMGLEKEVSIKTETNLSPLIRVNGMPLADKWADLKEMADYNNFIIHPTIHGINQISINQNTGMKGELFDFICEGLDVLLKYKFNFFPSIGANTVAPDDIKLFFLSLKKINKNLPLRIAVRTFSFEYDTVVQRDVSKRSVKISDPIEVIQVWDRLLREEYGVGYADIPRHLVDLY